MKRWHWIVVGVAMIVLLGLVLFQVRAAPVDVIDVQSRPLLRTLRFSARVAALSRVDIGATITGRVAEVTVREGAQVSQGARLIRLEPDELRAALAQASASERQAQARLDGLRSTGRSAANAAFEQATATRRAAESDLERQQALVVQDFVSPSRVDDARRAVDVARAQQDSARAQVQAIADSGTDVAQAQAQLALARAATAAARVRLQQADIVAPTDARVLTRLVEPGQIVQPGKALMTLALAGPTLLVAQVDERFLDQLQIGQPALVVADAFPSRPFKAHVYSIAPAVDAQRGAVEVKLTLDGDPPAFLREDMTLSVDVETGRRERALVVPLSALRGSGEADSVLVAVDGRAQERKVRLGLRTLEAAEVTDGLAAGERVLVRGTAAVGARVRPQAINWRPSESPAPGTREDVGSTLGNAFGR
jgi:HlyD family secretion protein